MILPSLGYEAIQIAPFQVKELKDLQIVRKINEHTRLTFTGIIPAAQKNSYLDSADAKTQVEVTLAGNGQSITFFKGPATKVQVKTVRDIYYLEVEALSHTYDLDIMVKNRSFQNGALTYTDMFQKVIATYPGADLKDTASRGATLDTFAIQYRLTDWQYLKQKASLFHAGLIPADTAAKPQFYIGVPEGDSQGDLDNFHYSVRKNIGRFRIAAENYQSSLQESDFVSYEVETGQILKLGDQINFKGKSLYVAEAISLMEQGLLKHRYRLTPKGGLSQETIYNPALTGASVPGKVLAVARDNVRVHLEIDLEQKETEAYWFPYTSVYTAEGNSGWYCMPEVGDSVRVYFPGPGETNAAAVGSIRQDSNDGQNNKVGNPDVKYFRTKSGKELMFSPSEIVITGKDGEVFVRLNDQEGIEIYSKQGLKLTSQKDLTLESAQKITITAGQEIAMECGESNLKMDGTTSIKGYEIKSN
ncbi:MAG: phage baseplate assembly protein V [Bacillota bacterium]|jgi:phage baseplate assembly protein gpV